MDNCRAHWFLVWLMQRPNGPSDIYRGYDFCVHSSLPSHKDVSYEQLLGALQRYRSCHQRLGQ